jgi:hypothetical protein
MAGGSGMIKLIMPEGRVISLEGVPQTKKILFNNTEIEILKIYIEGTVDAQELDEIKKVFDSGQAFTAILPERLPVDVGIPYYSTEFNGINYDIKINLAQR